MQQPIISVSGLRGVVGTSLDPLLVTKFVAAFCSQLPEGDIVVARDGRASGEMLAQTVCAAIGALGRVPLYADIAATPTVGVLVRQRGAAGGVQISASHNPRQYNGIKLFSGDGRIIPGELGQKVISAMDHAIAWASHDRVRATCHIDDITSEHIKLVLGTVDVEAVRQRRFRAILDSNHGAGSLAGGQLLEKLNVDCQVMGGEPNGDFAHEPEPTQENLREVSRAVGAAEVDIAFCQDPDADRLALIDEHGRYIGEECTLALALRNRLEQETGPCVVNCATSRMSLDVVESFGCECHLSAVGEANVCDLMLKVRAVYGGEGNGGPIDPRVGMVRDSLVGMAQTLDLMARSKKSLSQLAKELPQYSICKKKATVDPRRLSRIFDELQESFAHESVSRMDGLRLDWPDRWLLVRPSNTEPIVRVICEARDTKSAEELAEEAIAAINRVAR